MKPLCSIRPPLPRCPRRPVFGLSIVELMVGVAIGLFILAGATMLMTTQLSDNRRLMLETQVQQDLRAAADAISRDVRRAGYWGQAYRQVWPANIGVLMTNPYTALSSDNNNELVYDRSTDEEVAALGTDDNANSDDERFGFRFDADDGTIKVRVSDGNWQALTDPAVLAIAQFNLTLNTRQLPLPCGALCPSLVPGGCPLVQVVRDVTLVIVARAVHDPAVTRSLRENIRLRNDVYTVPAC